MAKHPLKTNMEIKTEKQPPKVESAGDNAKKPEKFSDASFGKESSAVKAETLAKPSVTEQLESKQTDKK